MKTPRRPAGDEFRRWLAVPAWMALAGVAAGAVWAWLAPASHSAVVVTKSGKRLHEYLGNEAEHYFDSAVMMIGLLVGLAVVSAVLVWQWRQRRGPAMVIGLTAGGVALAAAATGKAVRHAAAPKALNVCLHFRCQALPTSAR